VCVCSTTIPSQLTPAVHYVYRVHLTTCFCVVTNNDAEKCVEPHDCDVRV